ncbi:hypothetical protein MKP08_11730 [Erythrobacter sp. LQ02-29]|uniref:hypothetical protein n=1 Tax=Erythrobacter sp. LQ02-29 TaxID=2920384 RepID=UPI001F4E8427|nr:hypothetical protein [Erythrobacter sp. LQ02-29]MCP9223417.1 hypothetical protein [Erythrobacter sp. LQ02-29]
MNHLRYVPGTANFRLDCNCVGALLSDGELLTPVRIDADALLSLGDVNLDCGEVLLHLTHRLEPAICFILAEKISRGECEDGWVVLRQADDEFEPEIPILQ